ncbi:hypothetical protein DOTSEDRAFT_68303 [Dothistroma septosporum NZE10]|uniref:Uncharacterized protein n=1 Tax=Dothistroma septosporum (strain NZE10 / CBS 128990) TaxID=675120 RepID=N1Q155_DOTSN|nr:hypothetical protein DOTSEDRAFT_68303 [Dothistroma septosporum NZE10]
MEKASEPKPASPAASNTKVPAATTSAATPPHIPPKGCQSLTLGQDTDLGSDKSFAGKNNEFKKEETAPLVIPTVKVEPAEPTTSDRRIKLGSEESDYIVVSKAPVLSTEKTKTIAGATSVPDQSVTHPAADFACMMAKITALTKQVASLTNRVDLLESENFHLLGKIEPMCQMEERRRFLGTNDARSPFELSVKCPPDLYCKVQANAMLKVADLIRRVRVASKTSPARSPVPRLAADGQELGHALTLHEAGVTSNSSVEFMHEGASADEDEEL